MKHSKIKMKYHGRIGYPVIHQTEKGRGYIMVRAPKGRGTKRLYLVHGRIPAKYSKPVKHRR